MTPTLKSYVGEPYVPYAVSQDKTLVAITLSVEHARLIRSVLGRTHAATGSYTTRLRRDIQIALWRAENDDGFHGFEGIFQIEEGDAQYNEIALKDPPKAEQKEGLIHG